MKSRKASDHGSLQNYFTQSKNKDRNTIALILDRLRNLRNAADYDNPFKMGMLPLQAFFAVREAERILDLLKNGNL